MTRKTGYSYRKAHEILWKHGFWRYMLAPIGLSVILAIVLVVICGLLATFVSGWAQDWLTERFNWPQWLQAIWLILILAIGLLLGYVTFRALVMVCYGPFLERLSVKGEEIVTGRSHEVPRGVFEMIKRPLLMAVFSVLASVLAVAGGFLASLIPIIGVALSAIVLFPVQMFLSSIGFIDPYLDRSGYKARDSFRLMRHNFFGLFSFGTVGFLLTLVPVVGWFAGPTYSAAAGIVYAILLAEEEKERDYLPAP